LDFEGHVHRFFLVAEDIKHGPYGNMSRNWIAAIAFLIGILSTSDGFPADSEPEDSESGHGMPIVSLRSNYYGFADLKDPMPGTFEEELMGSMVLTSFKGVVPIPFADRTIVLVPGLFFDHTHLEYRNWDFGVTPAREQLSDFYATGLEMSMIAELSERVWFVTRLTWGLYSDLKEVDASDARLYGVLMADILVAENTVVGLGLSYNSDFGFPAPIPFAHFAYRNDWFRTDITIPSDAQAYFLPHERVEIGIRARLLGNEYRMTYEDEDWNNMLVQLSTLEFGGIGAVRLFRGLWLEFGGGAALRNRYKAILPNGNVLREINFSPTWFANAALVFRL
jgi:hypothetical protein